MIETKIDELISALNANTEALKASGTNTVSAPDTPEPEPAKKTVKKRAARKPKTTPAPEPEVVEAEIVEDDDLGLDDTEETPSIDDVIAVARKVAAAGNKPKLVEALKALGASKIPEIQEKDFGRFIKTMSKFTG